MNATAASATHAAAPVTERRRDSWLMRRFAAYSRRYIARNFDAMRVQCAENAAVDPDLPLALYFNHASWWDPLAGIVLMREVAPDRSCIAPIDAAMLERYGLLRRLGCFFPVEQGTLRGARQFLREGRAILATPGAALCVTPQGQFADVRQRPAGLSPGMARLLAGSGNRVQVLPLAFEYGFWNERTPNIFARFGAPFSGDAGWTEAVWAEAREARLVDIQDALAAAVIARDANAFRTVVGGQAGVGGIYDAFRRFMARLRGQKFDPRHDA
jgi:hypothetical protein